MTKVGVFLAKIVAIVNQKGGVGKTTTCVNLTSSLKEKGNRVLLCDFDPQANSTSGMGVDKAASRGVYDVLINGADVTASVAHTRYGDVLPSSKALAGAGIEMIDRENREFLLKQALDVLSPNYDFILIDCPPAFNAASAAALVAADDIIIPIKLDAFSLRGMGNLMRQISNMRKINPRLKLSGVLPTMWYRDAQMQDAEKMLADAGLTVFPHIRRSDKVDRMTWQQRPLLATSPNSAAGVDYRRFVKAYMRGGQENV